jgi:hypothetical protein
MNKEEISPIIKTGIRIMTQVNEGLEIEVVGEMERTEPSEHYPIGQLGASTIFRMWGMEEKVFSTLRRYDKPNGPFNSGRNGYDDIQKTNEINNRKPKQR